MPQDLIGCRKRRKLEALIPHVVVFVNDPSSAERRIDFAVFFIVLWSYGRKYALMCAMEIQKIHMVVHIFSGFALFTESECIVYRQLCSIRRKISHRCSRNFQCSHTGFLPSLFVKNKPRKLVSSLVGCLLLFIKIYVLKIGGNCQGKY